MGCFVYITPDWLIKNISMPTGYEHLLDKLLKTNIIADKLILVKGIKLNILVKSVIKDSYKIPTFYLIEWSSFSTSRST
jgi:hypothetical protein